MGASATMRPCGQAVERLLADLDGLAHLLHADDVAGPDVAAVRDGDVELELLVAGVGHVAADVQVDAGGAQRRAGDAEGDGVRGGEVADALEAAHPDGVAGEQVFVFGRSWGEVMSRKSWMLVEVERRLERDAADAEVAGHHALAGDGLEDAQELFALAEAVEEDGERADVHGVRAEPDEVGLDAGQLVEQDAEVLGALGDFELEQLLDREAVGRGCWPWGRGSRCGR